MRVKRLAPCGARIGEQDVNMRGVLLDAVDKGLYALNRGAIGRNGDGLRAGREVGEAVERFDGLLAGSGFARGYEDFSAACLEEAE